ncbi:hypothetical protein [Nocardia sp. NBC_01327]|uniref:hypothetical protein n=1 Tax=Nocardia sp. NBC_01327 TaxID=2903593 RepID=UPI002E161D38|nr:hypothetical protein OG326_42350 [Nocardia sp. NBC_01327]
MSRSKDDLGDRADAVHTDLLNTYGPDWAEHMWDDLHLDPATPAVEVPRPVDDEMPVTFTATLRMPYSAYRSLLERAKGSGTVPDQLISEWVTTEAGAENLDAISRDDVLRILARRHPHSA